jgi:hypothetical protein
MALSRGSILVACARTAMVVMACCNLGAGPFTSSRINYVVELFHKPRVCLLPRANQWLAVIARAPDVVAVSFPVDYSEYRLAGHARIPGIHGATEGVRGGAWRGDKATNGVDGALTVPLRLSEAGGHFSVEVAGGSGGPPGVFVLRVASANTVQILRGENAGRHTCRGED